MTANEVIELARHNTPLPDNATLTEGLLYKTMRLTYAAYREGEISKEQGTQERKNAVKQFDKYQLYEKAYRNNAKRGKAIGELLCEVNKYGCELCKRIAKIYDGREALKMIGDEKQIAESRNTSYGGVKKDEYMDEYMDEYIKREVLSKIMNDIAGDETCPMNIAADIYYAVDCIPAADVEPVVHGRWITHYRSGTPVAEGYVSTCCDMWNNRKSDYCPNCGAKMDKKDGQRR